MGRDAWGRKKKGGREGGRQGREGVDARNAWRWGGKEGVVLTFQSTGLEVGQDDDISSEQLFF